MTSGFLLLAYSTILDAALRAVVLPHIIFSGVFGLVAAFILSTVWPTVSMFGWQRVCVVYRFTCRAHSLFKVAMLALPGLIIMMYAVAPFGPNAVVTVYSLFIGSFLGVSIVNAIHMYRLYGVERVHFGKAGALLIILGSMLWLTLQQQVVTFGTLLAVAGDATCFVALSYARHRLARR